VNKAKLESIPKPALQKAIRICLIYYFNWLKGIGVVAFENLMEDAATVEIYRVQLWIWMRNQVTILKLERGKNQKVFDEKNMT